MPIKDRISSMWNAFRLAEVAAPTTPYKVGPSSTVRPHTPRSRYSSEKTIISSIYTRIGIDFAGVDIRHVKLDDKSRYLSDAPGSLNRCFSLEANIDQGPRAFRQDIVMTLFDEGVAAIVPVDIIVDQSTNARIEIQNMRVGKIVDWYPKHIKVSLYNENRGIRQDIIVEKRNVAIIENPLYAVMNEPNSTLQRLRNKLHLLDQVDNASSSGKMDLIIQLPYVVKSEARRQTAEQRRKDIEFQLTDSKYGIAYTDGTEKITQLNRPAENNLLKQIEYLTNLLYDQLGITAAVMNGTADEATMINYFNRTIEPLLDAATEGMQRAFLGRDGFEQQERIRYFRNPFKLVPLANVAEIADKFTRNEILSSNEIRSYIGIPPSDDPKADQLVNSNMPQPLDPSQFAPPDQAQLAPPPGPTIDDMDKVVNDVFDSLLSDLDKLGGG